MDETKKEIGNILKEQVDENILNYLNDECVVSLDEKKITFITTFSFCTQLLQFLEENGWERNTGTSTPPKYSFFIYYVKRIEYLDEDGYSSTKQSEILLNVPFLSKNIIHLKDAFDTNMMYFDGEIRTHENVQRKGSFLRPSPIVREVVASLRDNILVLEMGIYYILNVLQDHTLRVAGIRELGFHFANTGVFFSIFDMVEKSKESGVESDEGANDTLLSFLNFVYATLKSLVPVQTYISRIYNLEQLFYGLDEHRKHYTEGTFDRFIDVQLLESNKIQLRRLKIIFDILDEDTLKKVFTSDDSYLQNLQQRLERSLSNEETHMIYTSSCLECNVQDDEVMGSSASFTKAFNPFLLVPTKVVKDDEHTSKRMRLGAEREIERRNKMDSVCENELILSHYCSTSISFEKGNIYYTHDVIYANSYEDWEWSGNNTRVLVVWKPFHPYLIYCYHRLKRGQRQDTTFILPPCAWIVNHVNNKVDGFGRAFKKYQDVEMTPYILFSDMDPYWETFFSVKSPKKRNDEKEERKNVFIVSRDSFAPLYNSIQIKCYSKEESVPFRDSFLSVCDTEQKDVLYTLHVDRNVLNTKEDEMQIRFHELERNESPFLLCDNCQMYDIEGTTSNTIKDSLKVKLVY